MIMAFAAPLVVLSALAMSALVTSRAVLRMLKYR